MQVGKNSRAQRLLQRKLFTNAAVIAVTSGGYGHEASQKFWKILRTNPCNYTYSKHSCEI